MRVRALLLVVLAMMFASISLIIVFFGSTQDREDMARAYVTCGDHKGIYRARIIVPYDSLSEEEKSMVDRFCKES